MENLLIFDLDNTIYESATINKTIIKKMLSDFEEVATFYFGKDTAHQIIAALKQDSFDVALKKFNIEEKIRQEFAEKFRKRNLQMEIKPFSDFEVVKTLKEKKILVSEGFKELQEAKIRSLNLENLFSETYISNTLFQSRPSKKHIFDLILKRRQITPQHVFVIGDKSESELKAGRELGMRTVQVKKLNQENSIYAEFVISDFRELLNMLKS
ncbi:HAD family hydrolase [Autumnicola edwardsiae]|uniref:HAD family hydrolase n=1 Tax=Autumnicola edwardsiae TaxID=3075594 RepID=A0ABU3CZL4_9FLAO|nr:HAD family hydrolase [Zunongwangia sp. F297]MDT0651813.1 HAD family hydrolase [Zunongwangia sp. F297]